MQPASDDTEDARVVVTCAKNNDGNLGARSAWARGAGMFTPVLEFDWETYDGGGDNHREPKIREECLRQVFGNGLAAMKQADAAAALMKFAGVGRDRKSTRLNSSHG